MFEQARLPLSEVNVERQLISINIQNVLQKKYGCKRNKYFVQNCIEWIARQGSFVGVS